MAERLALPTLDHGVAGSNPAGGEILPEPKRLFIAPLHRLEMTEILLKGRKTLTHPSINLKECKLMYYILVYSHSSVTNTKRARVMFKILVIIFRIVQGTAPMYLASMFKRVQGQYGLRSSDEILFVVPRTRTRMADRSIL